MSLLTMGTIAVGRDLADPGQPLAESAAVQRELTAPPDDGSAGVPLASPASFGKLLVAQIPTEALIGYTTLLALFTAGGKGEYTIGRWALYGAAIFVCALTVFVSYFAQKRYGPAPAKPAPAATNGSGPKAAGAQTLTAPDCRPHLPWLPALTACLSMAVYGMAVPGSPLAFTISPPAFAISSACLAVGGGVMMSVFAPFLGRGNGVNAKGC
jgi:hypothetical protein